MVNVLRFQLALTRCYSSQATQVVPVVKIPVYVKKYVKEAEKKKALKERSVFKKIIYRGNTSIPVISSNVKEYNFYLGQVYNERYALPLQSKYWFKAKSSGQKFTIHPWDVNPSLPISPSDNIETYIPAEFSQLQLNGPILHQLKSLGYERPTPIQILSIPKIMDGHHILISAETGCGKTLAYLTPVLNQISFAKQNMKIFPETPLALILTPGRELAEQIADTAFNLAQGLGVNVKVLISDGTVRTHLKTTAGCNVDLLVASIGTIVKLFSKGVFKLANLKYLVLDEADTLLDDTFIEDTKYLLRHLQLQTENISGNIETSGTQIIFSSSIYPSSVDDLISEPFSIENIVKIKSPYLHRVLPHVVQQFWRVSNDNRDAELLQLVKSDYEKKCPVMIFCNNYLTCDWMSLYLEENGVPNIKFHGAVPPIRRLKAFQAFQEGKYNVMCCTDLASRGLDTQRVRHVINFDFPHNVSDYILRVGRVGRVGSNQGYVTSLIVSVPGVYTCQEIERSVRMSTQIPDVDSNIKKKIRKLYFTP